MTRKNRQDNRQIDAYRGCSVPNHVDPSAKIKRIWTDNFPATTSPRLQLRVWRLVHSSEPASTCNAHGSASWCAKLMAAGPDFGSRHSGSSAAASKLHSFQAGTAAQSPMRKAICAAVVIPLTCCFVASLLSDSSSFERLEDERCNIDNEIIQLQEELESMKKHDTCEPYY